MDLADPAIGSVISPDRSDPEILDFEMSKIWENIAKKYFLEKKSKISWEAFVSKYFISGIVLDFGGAAESLTQSISRISRYVLQKGPFFSQKVSFGLDPRPQPQNPTQV